MVFLRFLLRVVFHPVVWVRSCITATYLSIALIVNFFVLQVFCMPVVYAAILCALFFTAIIAFPLLAGGKIKTMAYLLLGMGVPICCYMVFFLADPLNHFLNYVAFAMEILFFGAGLLAFIPFYFLHHLRKYYRQGSGVQKRLFWAGAAAPFVALCIYLISFYCYLNKVTGIAATATNKQEFIARLPANHFTERTLGLYWKYHTNLEYIFDGWRPPLHDPFLVIAWYVLSIDGNPMWPDCNEEAIRYYHRKFPQKPVMVWCPCSYSPDGIGYDPDSIWHGPPGYLDEMEQKHKGHY